MPINLTKLNTKLDAIRSKDVAALATSQVNIPFLPSPYTAAQLQAWMDKRVTQLQNVAATTTDAQVIALRTTLYNGLNTAGKTVADKIIADQTYTIAANTTSANYDRLVGIILISWVLE